MKSFLKKYLPFKIILKIISKKNKINKYKVCYSDSLINENVKITISIINSLKELHIDLPKEIHIDKENGKRLKHCLQLWLPQILSLQEKELSRFSITLNASDLGEENILSMDSINERNLIPDEFSMEDYSKGYYEKDPINFDNFKIDWMKRKHIIFWRGSSTGKKIRSMEDLKGLKRVALCLKYNNSNNIDIKISRIVQSEVSDTKIYNWLESNNIRGSLIAEDQFRNYCYYLDIPGNALAWGTIRKHRMGMLIFRADHSRYLFYYNIMKPWVHYIPLRSDYSDIKEKYKWAEENINETLKIAYNGYIASNHYIKNIPNHFKKAITNYLDTQIK